MDIANRDFIDNILAFTNSSTKLEAENKVLRLVEFHESHRKWYEQELYKIESLLCALEPPLDDL